MLTESERSNLKWNERLLVLGAFNAILVPTWLIYAWTRAANNPDLKKVLQPRVVAGSVSCLIILMLCQHEHKKYSDKLVGKYLSGISDYEMNNFDMIY